MYINLPIYFYLIVTKLHRVRLKRKLEFGLARTLSSVTPKMGRNTAGANQWYGWESNVRLPGRIVIARYYMAKVKPSSNSGLPIAWITEPATDPSHKYKMQFLISLMRCTRLEVLLYAWNTQMPLVNYVFHVRWVSRWYKPVLQSPYFLILAKWKGQKTPCKQL